MAQLFYEEDKKKSQEVVILKLDFTSFYHIFPY